MKRTAETFCFPFYRERREVNKWFPIGWSTNIHSLGKPDDPLIRPGEWKYGNVENLIKHQPWINTLYLLPMDNHPAWGRPLERPSSQWTTTGMYLRALNYLLDVKNKYGVDIRAIVKVVSQIYDYEYRVSGTWDSIPEDQNKILKERIEILSNHPQMGGYMLADEPYHGDNSRKAGKRQYVYNELIHFKRLIEDYDKNIDNHPIHTVIRGNGNYHFDPDNRDQLKNIYLLNELTDLTDYIHDDLYLFDFINIYNHTNKKTFLDFTKERTEMARKVLLEQRDDVPNIRNKKAWTLWMQGRSGLGENSPYFGKSYLMEDELRYQAYCSWINGSQGAFFWELAKSDQLSLDISTKISKEAHYASQCLMQKTDIVSDVSCIEFEDNHDVQYIIRKDPNWFGSGSTIEKRYLLMICNNSKENSNCFVDFKTPIKKVESIVPQYNWSHVFRNDNKEIGVGLGGYRARAFFVYV